MHVCVLTRTLAGTRTLTSPGPGLSYSLGVPLVALGTQMAVLGSGLGIGSHSLNSTGLGKQMVELALGTTGVVAFGLKRFEGSSRRNPRYRGLTMLVVLWGFMSGAGAAADFGILWGSWKHSPGGRGATVFFPARLLRLSACAFLGLQSVAVCYSVRLYDCTPFCSCVLLLRDLWLCPDLGCCE